MRRISLFVFVLAACLLVPAMVSAAAETDGEASITNETLATIKGNVTDGVNPIAGATVVVIPVNNTEGELRRPTSPQGSFSIGNLQPGTYIVYAEMEGYSSGNILDHIKNVSAGENFMDLTLTGQPSTLIGTVWFEQRPLADVEVTISSGNFSRPPVTTSSEGRYVISNIPAGNYTVTFSKSGYRTAEIRVDMDGFKTQDMEMERMGLPISEGFLSGYDLAHSLMIVALGMAVGTLVIALLIRYRIKKRPEMLSKEESE